MSPLFLLLWPLLTQPSPDTIPAGSDVTWRNVGPGGGGWIEAIACDPVRPDVLHVGCDVGGYYRSDDGGRSYTIHNTGLRDYFIEAIAVSPRDPRTILLGAEGGIYKSTDDGHTWRWMRQGFPPPERYSFSAPVSCLAFDAASPDVVYAGIGRPRWRSDGHGCIYRSADCGETWAVCTPPGALPGEAIVTDIECAGGAAPYVLASTDQGIFRSDLPSVMLSEAKHLPNGSDEMRWQSSSAGLPHEDVQELAIAPSDPNVVYATLRTTARDEAPWNGGVVRSDDGGRTWTLRSEGLPQSVGKSTEAAEMTSCVKEIVVDPRDPDTAYAGDTAWVSAGLYKTTDGGRRWERSAYRTETESSFTDYGWITQWGPSVQCLSISPVEPGRLYFGTSGQIYTTSDAGATWEQRYCRTFPDGRFTGTGLEVTCLHDVVFDPHRPGRIYLCYYDLGLLITDDGGASFRRTTQGMNYDGNCFTVVPDPDDADLLWSTTGWWGSNHGDVCRSRDGGGTWEVIGRPQTGLPDGQTKVLRLDPASPPGSRHLYVTCVGYGLYRSLDGGERWECINGDLPAETAKEPRGLLLDPANAARLRAAFGGSPATGAGVYETTDGGMTWRRLNEGAELADIYDLAADPTRFDVLYACQRDLYDRAVDPPVMRPGGLLKSTDGGATWVQVLAYHFASCVALDPARPEVVYVGTTDHPYHDDSIAAGVLKSTDGGRTWQSENTGLTHLGVSCIRIAPPGWPGTPAGGAVLALGTGGNGAFLGMDAAPH